MREGARDVAQERAEEPGTTPWLAEAVLEAATLAGAVVLASGLLFLARALRDIPA